MIAAFLIRNFHLLNTQDMIDICEALTIENENGGLMDQVTASLGDPALKEALGQLLKDAGSQFQDFFLLDKPAPYKEVTEARLAVLVAAYRSIPAGNTDLQNRMLGFLEKTGRWDRASLKPEGTSSAFPAPGPFL